MNRNFNFYNLTHESYETIEILDDFVFCINESGFSDNFIYKGCFTMLSAQKKYQGKYNCRLTEDVDIHCGNYEKWVEFRNSINELGKYSNLNLEYKVFKVRDITSNGKSETVKIDVYYKGSKIDRIGIDMNLSGYNPKMEDYKSVVCSVGFSGYNLESMISDKLSVIVSKNIYKRAKDLYDMFIISQMYDYSLVSLVDCIRNKWQSQNFILPESIFVLNMDNIPDLEHAYNDLKGITNKPGFDDVYKKVIDFIIPICDQLREGYTQEMCWNKEEGVWIYVKDSK